MPVEQSNRRAPRWNARSWRRSAVAIVAMMATLLAVLAFSPLSADASESPGHKGNGVYFDGTDYYCDGKLAVTTTSAWFAGTSGDDVIVAMGADGQAVNGGAGDDTICIMAQGAFTWGGPGDDLIYTADLPDDWPYADQPLVSTTYGEGGSDYIKGGSGWDNIAGGAEHDMLRGGDGFDFIWGGPGRDFIDGGRNRAVPEGYADTLGDFCVDWESGLGDYGMNCERMIPMSAGVTIPDVPEDGITLPNCGHSRNASKVCPAGYSHFR